MGIPTIVPDGVTSWQLQAWALGGAPLVRNVGVSTVGVVLLYRSVTGGQEHAAVSREAFDEVLCCTLSQCDKASMRRRPNPRVQSAASAGAIEIGRFLPNAFPIDQGHAHNGYPW